RREILDGGGQARLDLRAVDETRSGLEVEVDAVELPGREDALQAVLEVRLLRVGAHGDGTVGSTERQNDSPAAVSERLDVVLELLGVERGAGLTGLRCVEVEGDVASARVVGERDVDDVVVARHVLQSHRAYRAVVEIVPVTFDDVGRYGWQRH